MRPYTRLYLHLVWATWERWPLIIPAIETPLHGAIAGKCRELGCLPLAIGGVTDHVHLLVRLHPAVAVATLVQQAKGSSSHLITHRLRCGEFFKWQGSYGAFTLRQEDLPRAERYVRNQKEHHATGNPWQEWEQMGESDAAQEGEGWPGD